MDSLKLALAMYYQENGGFPISAAATSVTYALQSTTLPAAGGTVWNSIGLSTYPTLPPEVGQLDYITDAAGASFNLTLTIAAGKIKAKTIDLTQVSITPTTQTPVAAAPTLPVQGTAIVWHYACGLGTAAGPLDAILTKYFNNAGAACTGTSA
jgi:hypothetical protein